MKTIFYNLFHDCREIPCQQSQSEQSSNQDPAKFDNIVQLIRWNMNWPKSHVILKLELELKCI